MDFSHLKGRLSVGCSHEVKEIYLVDGYKWALVAPFSDRLDEQTYRRPFSAGSLEFRTDLK